MMGSPDIPTLFWNTLAILASVASFAAVFLFFKRLRSENEAQLRKLFRKEDIKKRLRLLTHLKQKFQDAENFMRARESEVARAARLSQIPRDIRIVFEDLEALLDYVEASPDVDVESDPELKAAYCKALVVSAALALELENSASAIRRIRLALALGEDFISEIGEDLSSVYFILGTAYMMWGAGERSEDELNAAAVALERSIKIKPQTNSYYNLAWVSDELGRIRDDSNMFELAVNYLNQALELDPNDESARYNLACDLSLLGRQEAAVGELDRLLRHLPSDHELRKLVITDEDLEPIRKHPIFGKRILELLKQSSITLSQS